MNLYMPSGKRILIACSMIEDELNEIMDRRADELQDMEVVWMERGYHDDPDDLRKVIQEEIHKAEKRGAEQILLAYGLCGNGAVGWHAEKAVLAMPRFDDCINMMLCVGKRDRRNYEEAGNMYVTDGWSREKGAILDMYGRFIEKYGERRGNKVMKMMYDSYRAVTLIDTGCYEKGPIQEYVEKAAALINVETREVAGTNKIMEQLLLGPWDDNILVVQAGTQITADDFDFEG